MARMDRFRTRLMSRQADRNIDFADLCKFLKSLGFEQRIRGDHFIFVRDGIRAVVLQPSGALAKEYQVNQIRATIEENNL